jgi:hypothetical protein
VDKGSNRHIALMCWSIVCIPKQFGGLGLLNLKYMIRILLFKIAVEIFFYVDSVHLWKSILITKHNFHITRTLSFF